MAKKKAEVEPMEPPVTEPAEEPVQQEPVENQQEPVEPPAPEPSPIPAPPQSSRAAAVKTLAQQTQPLAREELLERLQQLEGMVRTLATKTYEDERYEAMQSVLSEHPELWDEEKKRFLFDTTDLGPQEIVKKAQEAAALYERAKVRSISEYEAQFGALKGMRPAPMKADDWQARYDEAKKNRDTGMMQAILEGKPDDVHIVP